MLDPTCGSGAFLFAALNILEPLYTACLEGMRGFLSDLERSEQDRSPTALSDFREVLRQVERHPSERYFILKSIVLNNLYGVDIMDEAVEICKLRLFLKLVAQLANFDQIEPLPDIDFNIRAGNTLVGLTSLDAVRQAMTITPEGQYRAMDSQTTETLKRIEENADIASAAFKQFRLQQTTHGGEVTTADKTNLRQRLETLGGELDRYLAAEYGTDAASTVAYDDWRASHQPFHWFTEFYDVMRNGGFNVIIGNPPYVEYSKVRKEYRIIGFSTERCGNIYANVLEQCHNIMRKRGRLGMIVQLPYSCTHRMKPIQDIGLSQSRMAWLSHFDDRPAKLFDGLQHIRATIVIYEKAASEGLSIAYSTAYNRWRSEARNDLFYSLKFNAVPSDVEVPPGTIPKIGPGPDVSVLRRITSFSSILKHGIQSSGQGVMYFHNAPHYWVRAMDFAPYFWNERDGEQISSQVKTSKFAFKHDAAAAIAALNSSLFYWWFLLLSDCRHLNLREILSFPLGLDEMRRATKERLAHLTDMLMVSFKQNSQRKETRYKTTGNVIYDEFRPKQSKPIIDEIDRVLAGHYGFTDEELDFIINYDIKYRMGLKT